MGKQIAQNTKVNTSLLFIKVVIRVYSLLLRKTWLNCFLNLVDWKTKFNHVWLSRMLFKSGVRLHWLNVSLQIISGTRGGELEPLSITQLYFLMISASIICGVIFLTLASHVMRSVTQHWVILTSCVRINFWKKTRNRNEPN